MDGGNKVQRILLSERTSKHLAGLMAECFAVVSLDRSDDRSGRYALHLIPCTIAQADAAVRVARGVTKESKPRPKPTKATIHSTDAA